jgi:hypothetical protein
VQLKVEEELPPRSTRTRKAKDTQFRLGVGRPAMAGGSGARAVTKSVSLGRGSGKRAKASKGAKATEPIIEEEDGRDNLFPNGFLSQRIFSRTRTRVSSSRSIQ